MILLVVKSWLQDVSVTHVKLKSDINEYGVTG